MRNVSPTINQRAEILGPVPQISEEAEIGNLFEVIEKRRNDHLKGNKAHALMIPEGLARPTFPAHEDDGDTILPSESRRGSHRLGSFDARDYCGELPHDSNMGPSLKKPVIFFPK
jgi:hypothetical protein